MVNRIEIHRQSKIEDRFNLSKPSIIALLPCNVGTFGVKRTKFPVLTVNESCNMQVCTSPYTSHSISHIIKMEIAITNQIVPTPESPQQKMAQELEHQDSALQNQMSPIELLLIQHYCSHTRDRSFLPQGCPLFPQNSEHGGPKKFHKIISEFLKIFQHINGCNSRKVAEQIIIQLHKISLPR